MATPVNGMESVIVGKILNAVDNSCHWIGGCILISSALSLLIAAPVLHKQAHIAPTLQNPFGDWKRRENEKENAQRA